MRAFALTTLETVASKEVAPRRLAILTLWRTAGRAGEVNYMRDDGVNYLQDLLVVPPEFLSEVAQDIHGTEPAAPFGRQG